MGRPRRHLIALGGGGTDPENLAVNLYILKQARRRPPAVGFIGTASGDSDAYLVQFYATFSRLDCRPSHLPFFRRTPDLRDYVLRQDVVFVGGGNTKSLLAVWRDWGLPDVLREAWEGGLVLAGVSAGAICWFEQGVTDSWAGRLAVLECLGFVRGSCCPHYDGEPERRPAYHGFLLRGDISPGLAIEDRAAVHLVDGEVYRVVSWHPTARAYRVWVKGASVCEEALPADYLG